MNGQSDAVTGEQYRLSAGTGRQRTGRDTQLVSSPRHQGRQRRRQQSKDEQYLQNAMPGNDMLNMSEQKMLAEYNAVAAGAESMQEADDTMHGDQTGQFLPQIQGGFGISGVREGRAGAQFNDDLGSDDGDNENVEQLYQA